MTRAVPPLLAVETDRAGELRPEPGDDRLGDGPAAGTKEIGAGQRLGRTRHPGASKEPGSRHGAREQFTERHRLGPLRRQRHSRRVTVGRRLEADDPSALRRLQLREERHAGRRRQEGRHEGGCREFRHDVTVQALGPCRYARSPRGTMPRQSRVVTWADLLV